MGIKAAPVHLPALAKLPEHWPSNQPSVSGHVSPRHSGRSEGSSYGGGLLVRRRAAKWERPLATSTQPSPRACRPAAKDAPGHLELPRPESGQSVCQWAPGPARWGSRCRRDRRETAPRQPGGPASSPSAARRVSAPPLPPGRSARSPSGCVDRCTRAVARGHAPGVHPPCGGPLGPRRRGPQLPEGRGADGAEAPAWLGAGAPRQRGRRRAWQGKAPRSASPKGTGEFNAPSPPGTLAGG